MRHIDEIIIHCTATRPEWMAESSTAQKVAEVRRWHVEGNKWNDIGYHYLIDRDGTVVRGRHPDVAGAHTKGHNANSLGVALFGGFGSAASDSFTDHYTSEQAIALHNLIDELKSQNPDIKKVSGHNQYSSKACPGFNVPRWMSNRPARTNPVQSKTVQASAVQIASGAGSAVAAVSAFEGTAQIVALVLAGLVILMGMWIMRERLRKWAGGDR